ncbi:MULTISPECIES: hypothetical protein [unclassified Bacillus (in: firmicutes)]|uniref:hypothetical protein n=1 Tax=unclassified Bacillus (in: firmicutes) TaxID=185979 RepID=UPI000B83E5F5|nr:MULTISPECIES: hypothetical protein [unclassified Bacillus (in: firmicutes)]
MEWFNLKLIGVIFILFAFYQLFLFLFKDTKNLMNKQITPNEFALQSKRRIFLMSVFLLLGIILGSLKFIKSLFSLVA